MEKLNGILEDIAAVIGYTATCSLVDWFGGHRSLYIPAEFDPGHIICKVIGEKAFRRLIEEWGNESLSLPFDYQRELARRDRLICALLAKGIGAQQVARIAMLSERQVRNIRARLEQEGLLPLVLKDGSIKPACDIDV